MLPNKHLGLWRQVKVILTLLPGHESGVGSNPTLFIRLLSSRSSGVSFLPISRTRLGGRRHCDLMGHRLLWHSTFEQKECLE